jgi:hypothetical protein
MADQQPLSMEMVVVKAITAAPMSREGWEELRGPDLPPMSEQEVFLENMTEIVKRHGVVIAQLAIAPETRAELQTSMPDAVERVPAWLEAKVNGPPLMTVRLFIRGLAQLMGEHRAAIERVVAEQVREPGPIEALLAAAPLPAGSEGESDSELIGAIGLAIGAHLEALVAIARDLDERIGIQADPR